MTDEEFEIEKNRVGRAIDRWFEPMGFLMWQQVQIAYHREPLTNDNGDVLGALADCNSKWEYLCAHLRFYLPGTARIDDDQLDYLVRHELLHALVDEMRPRKRTVEDRAHEERVVTQLAMVLGWVRDRKDD